MTDSGDHPAHPHASTHHARFHKAARQLSGRGPADITAAELITAATDWDMPASCLLALAFSERRLSGVEEFARGHAERFGDQH